ncbi:MAG TPA: metal ABC transporter ATP-binding protein [Candidatus Eisenbacteria bacterium]|nr:metal ABC transporter ATP-binding protein [Candidatus Eisenbacteria bacterium]
MNLITCENISFAYEGNFVVQDINFSVQEGDYLCIVGENGTGKSTLLNGLLNLKKSVSGKITFAPDLSENEIGYLPQQTLIQKDFPASVYEVVLSGCLNKLGYKPFYTKKEKTKAKLNMEHLGITNLKKKCYRNLSGGQQQRVLLARALCATEKIIILDEPVSGLDPLVTIELYKIIEKINQEFSITIIMVSHDINSAVKYASHILHLQNQQLFFGRTENYLKSDISKNFMEGNIHV